MITLYQKHRYSDAYYMNIYSMRQQIATTFFFEFHQLVRQFNRGRKPSGKRMFSLVGKHIRFAYIQPLGDTKYQIYFLDLAKFGPSIFNLITFSTYEN